MTVLFCGCEEEVIFDFEENLSSELLQIDLFLQENDINVQTSARQLRYREVMPGAGAVAEDLDTVSYTFQIYLLDSTLINTNIEILQLSNLGVRFSDPGLANVVIGVSFGGGLPEFINFAIAQLPEGGVMDLFVPSYLAYGSKGGRWLFVDRKIPSNTPIIARIEIVEIKR